MHFKSKFTISTDPTPVEPYHIEIGPEILKFSGVKIFDIDHYVLDCRRAGGDAEDRIQVYSTTNKNIVVVYERHTTIKQRYCTLVKRYAVIGIDELFSLKDLSWFKRLLRDTPYTFVYQKVYNMTLDSSYDSDVVHQILNYIEIVPPIVIEA